MAITKMMHMKASSKARIDIRKTPCVLQHLVREPKISLKPSQYMPLAGQLL